MVHIEETSAYIRQLQQAPQLEPMIKELLHDGVGDYSNDASNALSVSADLLIALKTNDRLQAEEIYRQFSRRQPTRDSHWIYDNYAVFGIVSAVRFFQLPTQWIRDVIDLSYSAASNSEKKTKDTFKNILSGNFDARGDYHQISLVYLHLAKSAHFNEDTLNAMYLKLWLKDFPFFENGFLNVVSLKAVEIAYTKKGLLTPQKIDEIERFIPIYQKRANALSNGIAWLIVLGIAGTCYYILWRLNILGDHNASWGKVFNFTVSTVGIGVSAFFGWRKPLAGLIRNGIDRLFGYKINVSTT